MKARHVPWMPSSSSTSRWSKATGASGNVFDLTVICSGVLLVKPAREVHVESLFGGSLRQVICLSLPFGFQSSQLQ